MSFISSYICRTNFLTCVRGAIIGYETDRNHNIITITQD